MPRPGIALVMTASIAAAVIVAGGRLLLVRQDSIDGEPTWNLPYGVIEDGESAEDAVVRETLRAVGLTVAVRKALCEAAEDSSDRTVTYLACTPVDDATFELDATALNAHEWCGQPELLLHLRSPLVAEVQRYNDNCVG